jgi:hypothetical protein
MSILNEKRADVYKKYVDANKDKSDLDNQTGSNEILSNVEKLKYQKLLMKYERLTMDIDHILDDLNEIKIITSDSIRYIDQHEKYEKEDKNEKIFTIMTLTEIKLYVNKSIKEIYDKIYEPTNVNESINKYYKSINNNYKPKKNNPSRKHNPSRKPTSTGGSRHRKTKRRNSKKRRY